MHSTLINWLAGLLIIASLGLAYWAERLNRQANNTVNRIPDPTLHERSDNDIGMATLSALLATVLIALK